MKKSFLYLAFTIAACISGPALALSTTFAEFDEMTFEEQSKFISERAMTIYDWLEINEPAIAKCMNEKFELDVDSNKPPEALITLESKIKGVPVDVRPKYHVENLMANYIIDNLCASAKTKPAAVDQPSAK